MNLSNMSPSHRLQFFTNCSSMGAFPWEQSFRNRLLQHGSLTRSQVLPANLLQHGLPMGSQPPSGIHVFWHGILHRLQMDLCSTLDLHGLQGHGCLTMGCRGISALAPAVPPPSHSSLIWVFAEMLLTHVLTSLFGCHYFCSFFPF